MSVATWDPVPVCHQTTYHRHERPITSFVVEGPAGVDVAPTSGPPPAGVNSRPALRVGSKPVGLGDELQMTLGPVRRTAERPVSPAQAANLSSADSCESPRLIPPDPGRDAQAIGDARARIGSWPN